MFMGNWCPSQKPKVKSMIHLPVFHGVLCAGISVAFIAFKDCKAEQFLSSITKSFCTVLGQHVEVQIALLSAHLKDQCWESDSIADLYQSLNKETQANIGHWVKCVLLQGIQNRTKDRAQKTLAPDEGSQMPVDVEPALCLKTQNKIMAQNSTIYQYESDLSVPKSVSSKLWEENPLH